MILNFMNILKNFQQFYEVYTESPDVPPRDPLRKALAQKCFEINMKYIQKQLDHMKRRISGGNIRIYAAVEGQVKSILAKYMVP